jgi:glycosyltransferase involved in cell wall biosynthesis
MVNMIPNKILYICDTAPGGKNGGAIIEYRNKRILEELSNLEACNIFFEPKKSFIQKTIDAIFSDAPMVYSFKQSVDIKRFIKNSDSEIVFFETSKMGGLVKYAKKCNKKTIVFFHNCEKTYWEDTEGSRYIGLVSRQEKLSLKNADYSIFLNNRDLRNITKNYNFKPKRYSIIPISFKNYIDELDINYLRNKEKGKTGLFFGSFFSPNYNGIKWFVNNVAANIKGNIQIVGIGFEKHNELSRDNVQVIGAVDNIADYVKNADYVVFPIFEGSGMKVKTAEALMCGKKIFASDEALEGYDIEGTNVERCNSVAEFTEKINSYINNDEPIYCENTRKKYLEKYSEESVTQAFRDIILNIYQE